MQKNKAILSNNADALYNTPLLIKPEYFGELVKLHEARVTTDYFDKMLGLELSTPVLEVEEVDGQTIAIINIEGCIGYNLPEWQKLFGMVDMADTSYLLDMAKNLDEVDGILLYVGSAGGSVTHVPEVAKQVQETRADKPIMVYTDTLNCSAAYYISAGATCIYASESSDIGSVGVYMALLDSSEMYKKLGYHVELIKAGKFKASGLSGMPLEDGQRAELQRGVDHLYNLFINHIKDNRPQVSTDTMQGQCFFGGEALELGLVDSITNYKQALADIASISKTGV